MSGTIRLYHSELPVHTFALHGSLPCNNLLLHLRWRVHINIHKLIIYSVLLFVITGKQRI